MKIVFLDHHTLNADGLDLSPLTSLGNVDFYERTPPGLVKERCQGAEIVISNKVVLNEDILKSLPDLKYIVVAATGYNNIDTQAAAELKIPVSNVSGYSTEGVVQHTFALLFAILNKVADYNNKVQQGRWVKAPDFCFYDHTISEVAGKTMGIYGYGTIGKRIAQVATTLGMKVKAYTRSPEKEIRPAVSLVSEEELFTTSDIISIHAPLNGSTKGLINKHVLSKMKSTSILINTARGPIVNEADLADALKDKIIAAAALDTLSVEPQEENHVLLGIPNCIITPHIAWASLESRMRLLDGICENIISFQKEKVINQVNKF